MATKDKVDRFFDTRALPAGHPLAKRPLNRLVMCDCLNHCGDDPDIAKGKAMPCRSKIKWDEVHQRKSQAINVCMAIYQDQPQGIIGSEQVHRAWEIGKRLTELLGT